MVEAERSPWLSRRPERPDDETFLRQLFRETRGDILAGLDAALTELLMRQQFAGQSMTYRARFPTARFDIVEADGVAVGRIVVNQTGDALHLVDVALLAAWRGRGIGTRLITDLLEAAAAASLPVDLSVVPDNEMARRLYARLGFIPVAAAETEINMRWRSVG